VIGDVKLCFLVSPTDNQIFNNRVTKTTSCIAEKSAYTSI